MFGEELKDLVNILNRKMKEIEEDEKYTIYCHDESIKEKIKISLSENKLEHVVEKIEVANFLHEDQIFMLSNSQIEKIKTEYKEGYFKHYPYKFNVNDIDRFPKPENIKLPAVHSFAIYGGDKYENRNRK